jgi:hypothetical protein
VTANADAEEARARAEMRAVMICIGDVSKKMEPIAQVWCGGMKMGEMGWDGMMSPVESKIEAFYVGEETLEKV